MIKPIMSTAKSGLSYYDKKPNVITNLVKKNSLKVSANKTKTFQNALRQSKGNY
jgi:hypothetical protein